MALRMNSISKACIPAESSRTETAITRNEARAPTIQAIAFSGSFGRMEKASLGVNHKDLWYQVSRVSTNGRVTMESAVWTAIMPASRRASPPNCRARM